MSCSGSASEAALTAQKGKTASTGSICMCAGACTTRRYWQGCFVYAILADSAAQSVPLKPV